MDLFSSRPLLKITPLLILIFAALGCGFMETVESTKIPQAQIEQTYDVTARRENTLVTAHFYYGGLYKSVDLDAPSKIEHNGAELPQVAFDFPFGTRYAKNLSGLETRHSFVYTNNDGKVFRNELSFAPIELPSEEIAFSHSREVKIQLSRPVEKDENVSITLKSLVVPPDAGKSNTDAPVNKSADQEDYDISLTDELDATRAAIILKPKNFKKFVRGKAVLSLRVTRTIALQQANESGGFLRYNYDSTCPANVID